MHANRLKSRRITWSGLFSILILLTGVVVGAEPQVLEPGEGLVTLHVQNMT